MELFLIFLGVLLILRLVIKRGMSAIRDHEKERSRCKKDPPGKEVILDE